MDLRIEYATTADGVSIAYTSVGDGIALVNPPPALPWSNVEMEWQIPEWRHYYEHLTETMRLVRYDNRGAGLSTRAVGEITLATHILDLEAVVDRLGLDRFVLFGLYFNAQIAISYAVKHPERVSHLILWCPVPSGEDNSRDNATSEALDRLRELDYNLFTETLAHTVFGWESGEAAHQMALYMQGSMSQETFQQCWTAAEKIDVRDLLPQIQAPTLVVHRRDFKQLDIEVSKQVAASIPNARLAILPGESLSPYMGDLEQTVGLFNDFVGLVADASWKPRHPHPEEKRGQSAGFQAILFTDMEGSTSLTQRLGDDRAQALVRHHDTIVGGALYAQGGRQIKHTGDGIMASFPTASGAIECAIAVQRAFEMHNAVNPNEAVNVRIGVNAGEPVSEGDDLFGTAVQLASRVCARAEPGEILTTDVVRQLVAGKDFMFSDGGMAELRGFEDPVRIFQVRWHQDGA